ncbi:hypothetical protein MRX96_009533 [Rhipicephalus microplus]
MRRQWLTGEQQVNPAADETTTYKKPACVRRCFKTRFSYGRRIGQDQVMTSDEPVWTRRRQLNRPEVGGLRADEPGTKEHDAASFQQCALAHVSAHETRIFDGRLLNGSRPTGQEPIIRKNIERLIPPSSDYPPQLR